MQLLEVVLDVILRGVGRVEGLLNWLVLVDEAVGVCDLGVAGREAVALEGAVLPEGQFQGRVALVHQVESKHCFDIVLGMLLLHHDRAH